MAECGHCEGRRKTGKGPCKDHIQFEGDMIGKTSKSSGGVVSMLRANRKRYNDRQRREGHE